MKKVFIKYNPYKLETKILVDNKKLALNSKLGDLSAEGSRLQEWVEDLPQILVDEYNDIDFEITFHGTLLDYEDLSEVLGDAIDRRILSAKLNRIPAKETSDKEVLINNFFEKIQNGPFEELKEQDIVNAFNNAKNSDFEVCVVATMSAGKSTLINAMLGSKLMPSKQEACTAIITKIKDTDSNIWRAEVYDKSGNLIETQENLSFDIMSRLNSDENVSEIHVTGNIPFVQSDDVSLVLIDTPGPNNTRNEEHRRIQEGFLGKSSKSLILYIMEGTFGSTDDNSLLDRVSESMSVGGKQSKDRFLFVINKMDNRKEEDGDTESMIDRVTDYLRNHYIYNPNFYPAAALPALNIRRLKENGEDALTRIEKAETITCEMKLNEYEMLHLEKYASLPLGIKENINEKLEMYIKENDEDMQALIHTGIPSLEAAIRQYVQKYAKTAKIKNIADTFIHKLDEVGCFEETKKELAFNQAESERIITQIERINKKIDSAKEAKNFKDSVEAALTKVNNESREIIQGVIKKYQTKLTQKIDGYKDTEFMPEEVEDEVESLNRFVRRLEPEFREDLDELIRDNLIKTGTVLLNGYKQKLTSLTEEIDLNGFSCIKIDPFKLMSGSVNMLNREFDKREFIQKRKVEDGEEWVENTNKKWYKPWTWFQEDGYFKTKYKTEEYIKAKELVQSYLNPVEKVLFENGENAEKYAKKQSLYISENFNKEFSKLDNILKQKLSELTKYVTEKDYAEEKIKETEEKLNWLNEVKSEVESILEI